MSALASIILRSGIVPDEAIKEFRRWRLPLPEDNNAANPLLSDRKLTADGLVEAIEQAMQDEGYVLTRETDLDVLDMFLTSMRPAVLHLFTETQKDVAVRTMVGRHRTRGDYILPWQTDSINDWLTNGETYLEDGDKQVYFSQANDLFYGSVKAFVLCTPSGASS